MSRTAKRAISVILSLIMAIAAAFIMMPPVSASAASSTMITYKITYTAKYAKLTLTPKNTANTIYYTTNGTQPTRSSAKYTATLAAGKSVVIRAAEYNKSGTKVATIKVTLCPRVLTPKITVSKSGGTKYLTVTTSTANADIYYTTDGTVPTQKSLKYTGKVKYTSGAVYVFKGFRTGFTASQAMAYSDADEEQFTPTADQKEVLELVNKERKAAGAAALKIDEGLCEAAEIRAKEIVTKFSHERPDGTRYVDVLESLGITNVASAENIAEGFLTPAEVMDGWMHSSGHKKNILSTKYTHIGIARVTSGGRSYWVQIFGAF